jgi:peptide-methionine (R)-S-oxide reductase
MPAVRTNEAPPPCPSPASGRGTFAISDVGEGGNLLPLPLAGEGWGGGSRSLHSACNDGLQERFLNRRQIVAASALSLLPWRARAAESVEIEFFDASGKSLGVSRVDKVVKTDAEWRKQLSALAYDVTRHEGTERAFTGPYWDAHDDGLFRCICCDTTLFDSKTKYDSGTGWPSFFAPISKTNVVESVDNSYGMRRVAVSCRRCDAHLGHVFTDGPKPTGLRYCMNGVALRFVPRGAA